MIFLPLQFSPLKTITMYHGGVHSIFFFMSQLAGSPLPCIKEYILPFNVEMLPGSLGHYTDVHTDKIYNL